MLGQRLEGGGPHPGELRAAAGRGLKCGVDLLADQRDRPVELPDRGFQVHPRHPPELPPGLGQHRGNLRQPPGHRTQPVAQRREVPGQQLVDGLARVGLQRVPGVLAQLVDLEHPPRHAVRHHRGVHPVLGRQGTPIDRGEPRGPAVKRTPFGLKRLRRGIRQARVEPVIAEAGGGVWVPFGPVVQVLPG